MRVYVTYFIKLSNEVKRRVFLFKDGVFLILLFSFIYITLTAQKQLSYLAEIAFSVSSMKCTIYR